MRWIKLIAILSLGLFFFGVLVVLHLCISVLRLPNRWKIVSRWIRGFTWSMIRILNIKITVEGDAGQLERGGCVIISNHFGYLDGIVLGSLFPVIFVSKQEVKSWPVVGQWTTLCGTVFINRQSKGLIPLAVTEIEPKTRAKGKYFIVSRRGRDQWRTDVALSDRSVGGAFAEPGDYRTAYFGLSKCRRTTHFDGQP